MILSADLLGPSALWYLTRATGAVSLVLLTASVVLGVLEPVRVRMPERWPRFVLGTIHRDVSLLVVVLLLAHIATSVLDGFAPIGWLDAVIPLHSAYRPLWLGLGALAFDLIVALIVTSLLRRRLGYPAWRTVHWLAYASFPVAVLHGIGSGTDTAQAWSLLLTAACLLAVAVAVVARTRRASARRAYGAAAVAVPLLIAGFTAWGPLQKGWSRKAGTPARLLAHRTVRRVAVVPVSLQIPPSFADTLIGSLIRHRLNGTQEIEELDVDLTGSMPGKLRIRLGGQTDAGGGLTLAGSQVDLAPDGARRAFSGKVTSLAGGSLTAEVTDSTTTVQLQAVLNVDESAGSVSGQLSGRTL